RAHASSPPFRDGRTRSVLPLSLVFILGAAAPGALVPPRGRGGLRARPLVVLASGVLRVLTAGSLNALVRERGRRTGGRHQAEHESGEPYGDDLARRTRLPVHRATL